MDYDDIIKAIMVCYAIVVFPSPTSPKVPMINLSVDSFPRSYNIAILKNAFRKYTDSDMDYLTALLPGDNGLERMFDKVPKELQCYVFVNANDQVMELQLLELDCEIGNICYNRQAPWLFAWDRYFYCDFDADPLPRPIRSDLVIALDIPTIIRSRYALAAHFLLSKFGYGHKMFITEKSKYASRDEDKFITARQFICED